MDFETELQSHNGPLLRACAIRSHEYVLDIGCGTGHTTREAARQAATGRAVGVDITEAMIVRARARAAAEDLHNVSFEHDDAQVHAFAPQSFDLAFSRYGTMFFADPIAAFRNIFSALRPDSRLVMMVWQAHEVNEWSVAVHQALAPYESLLPNAYDHFSFADPNTVKHVLGTAGFTGVNLFEVREPVYYGASVDDAMEWVRGFRFARNILERLDDAANMRVEMALRESLARYSSAQGVWIDAREWIATANRP